MHFLTSCPLSCISAQRTWLELSCFLSDPTLELHFQENQNMPEKASKTHPTVGSGVNSQLRV